MNTPATQDKQLPAGVRVVRFEGVTLYNADCLDVLPTLAGIDAVVTDPPYGIKAARATRGGKQHGNAAAPSKDYGFATWDDAPAGRAELGLILGMSVPSVIWGGNYFQLPPMAGWLFWDKDNGSNGYADGELAWTNLPTALRKKRFRWMGMLQENMAEKEERFHPTQKPVPIMAWCLDMAKVPVGATVLDPYMGSGTTGIACIRTGRKFIGVEKDAKHFDTACDRIRRELAQGQLFTTANQPNQNQ